MKKSLPILLSLASLSACGPYQLSLNEKVLYDPPVLFAEFQMEDAALQKCITQTIKDQSISKVEQLHRLNCSHAGLQSLHGIELFSALEELKFNSNQIDDLTPLASLKKLSAVFLNDNRIKSIVPLTVLENLNVLEVDGNPELDCAELVRFNKGWSGMLTGPEHCEGLH